MAGAPWILRVPKCRGIRVGSAEEVPRAQRRVESQVSFGSNVDDRHELQKRIDGRRREDVIQPDDAAQTEVRVFLELQTAAETEIERQVAVLQIEEIEVVPQDVAVQVRGTTVGERPGESARDRRGRPGPDLAVDAGGLAQGEIGRASCRERV